jgi:hypothetical protein
MVSKADQLLLELDVDERFAHTINPTRDAKLAEALHTVGARLPAPKRAALLGGLAQHAPSVLLMAAAKGLDEVVLKLAVDALRSAAKKSFLADRLNVHFFLAAASKGKAPEGARLVLDLNRPIHFPALVKLLKKGKIADDVLTDVARSVLAKKATGEWLSDFMTVFGLLGVLAQDGSPASIKVVDQVRRRLEEHEVEDEVRDSASLIDKLLTELAGSKAPAKAVARAARKKVAARRAGSPAKALADSLGLSFADTSGWRVSIWLAEGEPNIWFGAMQNGYQVNLRLDEADKPHFRLELRGEKSGIYSNWGGTVSQDDFGLPQLSGLEQFPAWLRQAGNVLKTSFSVDKAKIDCGRYRGAVAPLRAWLATG